MAESMAEQQVAERSKAGSLGVSHRGMKGRASRRAEDSRIDQDRT